MKTESEVSIRISEKEVQNLRSLIWYIKFSLPIVCCNLYKYAIDKKEVRRLKRTAKLVASRLVKTLRRILNHG